MRYCDLHCDALTTEGVALGNGHALKESGCLLQCFAAFLREREGRFAAAMRLADRFDKMCAEEGLFPVRRASELKGDGVNALLTVEEGGAVEGELEKLDALYERGVRMMTLTWNFPNEIGFPSAAPEGRGLTAFGREVVERMNELGMIADVSHGSRALVEDVAKIARAPFVASHSCAYGVRACPRNLSDREIRLIADSGGAVGLCFCADFLSEDGTEEGQRSAAVAHARRILNAGGEDALALGSDFDGAKMGAYLNSPADVPRLLEEFARVFGMRIAEKAACGNALRVLIDTLK